MIMKLNVRRIVAMVLSFLMVFAIAVNPAYAQENNDYEDAMKSVILNTNGGNVETSGIAAQRALLQSHINHAYELLDETLVDIPPGVNTPPSRLWTTQEARDALLAAIAAAQVVLDASADRLTIILHNSSYGMPIEEAKIEVFVNNVSTVHQVENGIILFEDISAGSNIRLNIDIPCDTVYQFPKWEVAKGNVAIPPFAETPQFIMPNGDLVIIAEFHSITEYYFDWDLDLKYEEDSTDAFIELYCELDTDNTFDVISKSQLIEWDYGFDDELITDFVDWVEISASEPIEYFFDLEYGKIRHIPYTLNIDVDSFSVYPQNDPNTLTLASIPGSVPMLLPFGVSWTATVITQTPWLTISNEVRVPPHTNDSFVINVNENFGPVSRTGRIRVDLANGTSVEITVIQDHGPALYIPGDSLPLPAVAAPPNTITGGIVDVFTNSNLRWNVSISSNATSWLSVGLFKPANQTGFGEFAILAQPNFGLQRTGIVTISAQGVPGLSRTVTVVQSAGNVIVLSAEELGAPPFPYSGTVNVSSNTTWNMPTSNVNWLTVSNVTPPNRNGNGSFQINTTTANIGNSPRTGTITVSAPGAHSRTVRIVQEPGQGFVLSGEYWEAPPNPSFANARVYSNKAWDMPTTNRDWLTISHVTPSNRTGNGSFRINAAAHTGNGIRTGTVTITSQGSPERTVTVVQQPGAVLALSANSGSSSAAPTSGYVTVTSNRAWNVSSDASWLRVDNFNPVNQSGNGSFRISTTENTLNTPRTGTITVTAAGAPTRTIFVAQMAGGTLTLSMSTWSPTSSANSSTVRVNANGAWTVASNSTSWLTTNVTSGNGNGTFIINARPNTGTNARMGVIAVTSGGITRNIIVTQTNDPGLKFSFSWTEDEDQWILLERAVQTAGGTTSRSLINNAITANVYGVTVQFVPEDPGFSDIRGLGVAVRADAFYRRIVNAAGGEVVFLGGHLAFDGNPILFGSLHTYVKMFVSQASNHWGNGYFGAPHDLYHDDRENTTKWGLQFATLSGIAMEGNSGIMHIHGNAPYDLRFDNTAIMQHLYSGVGAIDDLLDAESSQGEGWIYGSLLVPGVTGPHVCNNILSGLLHVTGLHPGELANAPGWNQPTPASYFGR
ncbi:MAG: hypothetical protein FWE27_09945 [Defluviitaleaceae bacterium]|nr:hypothetical protein [Defluviitaleaceae bacterium]